MAAGILGCEAGGGGLAERVEATAGVGAEAVARPPPPVVTLPPIAPSAPVASRQVTARGGSPRAASPEPKPTTPVEAVETQRPTPARSLTVQASDATRDVTGQVETPRGPGADEASRAADLAACRSGVAVPEPNRNAGLVEDCVVLLAVRAGSNQDWRLNWSTNRPISEWEGVTLGGLPLRVHDIDLAGHDLGGAIPPALGRLTALQLLDLSNNQLVGAIPPQLGGLPHLKELRLGQNALRGTIPAALGRPSGLRHLSLFNNELSGPVPAELGDLQTLFHLNLAVNGLSGPIPSELGRLPHLTFLALGHNRLSGSIPPELGQLSNLSFLDLADNQLSGRVPAELGRLYRLQGLFLSDNQLTGPIPQVLGKLPDLTHLELDGNSLTGERPRLIEVITTSHAHPSRPCNPGMYGIDRWFWDNGVQWHPDGSVVFFSQGPLVYAAAVDGSRVWLVADAIASDTSGWFTNDTQMTSFDLSPNGDFLVYATCAYRREPMGPYGYGHSFDIAVVDVERGSVQRLTDNDGFENYPSWSPNGSQIAFVADSKSGGNGVRNTRLVVMTADGSGRRLVNSGGGSAVLHPPQWSSDGTRLAVLGTRQSGGLELRVESLGPDDVDFQQLGRIASGPAWSPDGARLAVVTTDEATGGDRILVSMAADGSQVQEVPLAEDRKPGYGGVHSDLSRANWVPTLAWSPAGDQLLYTCGWQVCVVATDGTHVGSSPIGWGYVGSVATWSPDGSRIAVAAGAIDETGPVVSRGPVLYTMAPDGSDVQVLAQAAIRVVAARAWRLNVAERTEACASGYVVSEPEANPGLVRDCAALVGMRDALFGEDDSNWNPGTPIRQWVGVTVEGDPPRVAALEKPTYRLVSVPERPIPEGLSALTHLHTLDLSQSKFVGPIPRGLVQLESLAHLDLSGNDLTGLPPPDLSRLSNLITLDLSRNDLAGPIPNDVIQLTSLQRLDLSGNGLTGPMPAELGTLAKLEALNLSGNRLMGSIPPALGRLAQLRTLDLSGNRLTGSIPAEIGRLAALKKLDLRTNQLTGPIPPGLDGLTRLEWIRLTKNDLTGCIPPRLKFRLELAGCLAGG